MRLVYFLAFYSFLKCQVSPWLSWQKHAVSLFPTLHPVPIPPCPHLSPDFSLPNPTHWRTFEVFTLGTAISMNGLIFRSTIFTAVTFLVPLHLNGVSSMQAITIAGVIVYRRKLFRLLQLQGFPLISAPKQGQSCARLLELPWLNWWLLQAWTDPLLSLAIILHRSGLLVHPRTIPRSSADPARIMLTKKLLGLL